MVCAVHHFKLNWNKTARQKNENSMTMCYKCACYYDEWHNRPVAPKIQVHAGQVISLKYGDQVFMSFWHCICTYFHSLHLLFSSIKKNTFISFLLFMPCALIWEELRFFTWKVQNDVSYMDATGLYRHSIFLLRDIYSVLLKPLKHCGCCLYRMLQTPNTAFYSWTGIPFFPVLTFLFIFLYLYILSFILVIFQ